MKPQDELVNCFLCATSYGGILLSLFKTYPCGQNQLDSMDNLLSAPGGVTILLNICFYFFRIIIPTLHAWLHSNLRGRLLRTVVQFTSWTTSSCISVSNTPSRQIVYVTWLTVLICISCLYIIVQTHVYISILCLCCQC